LQTFATFINMVSIDPSPRNQHPRGSTRSGGGGHFFDHDASANQEEEPLFQQDLSLPRITHPQPSSFRSIPTLWVLSFQILLLICSEIVIFLLPWYCKNHECGFPSYSWIIIWQAVLWIMFLALHAYVSHHHDKVRLRGYLDFYRNFAHYKWYPFVVLSAGCVLTMVASIVVQDMCTPPECLLLSVKLEPVVYFQVIMTLQVVSLIPFLIVQIKKTYTFNSRRYPPDAQREEIGTSGSYQYSPLTDLGFRGEDNIEDVMERQEDIIRYLRQHNSVLSSKILELSEQLDHLQRTTREQRAVIYS